jgi:hypothetical protein
MGGIVWSAQEDAHIVAMTPVSDGWDKVTAGLNRTHGSVRLRARLLGVSLDRDAVKRRLRASARKTFSDPVVAAARGRTQSANYTPEQAEVKRQRAKALGLHLNLVATPEVAERRIAGIRAFHRKKLGFCPDYLLPFYREMKSSKGMSFAERKDVISETFGRDLGRALKAIAAAIKPYAEEQRRQYHSFEAELERARVKGIREVVHLHKPEFHLSLTGGSLA